LAPFPSCASSWIDNMAAVRSSAPVVVMLAIINPQRQCLICQGPAFLEYTHYPPFPPHQMLISELGAERRSVRSWIRQAIRPICRRATQWRRRSSTDFEDQSPRSSEKTCRAGLKDDGDS
jgi:hypothetical protein